MSRLPMTTPARPDLDALERLCQKYPGTIEYRKYFPEGAALHVAAFMCWVDQLDTNAQLRDVVLNLIERANALPALIAYARRLEAERDALKRELHYVHETVAEYYGSSR